MEKSVFWLIMRRMQVNRILKVSLYKGVAGATPLFYRLKQS